MPSKLSVPELSNELHIASGRQQLALWHGGRAGGGLLRNHLLR